MDVLNAIPSALLGIAGVLLIFGCVILFTVRRWEMIIAYILFSVIEQHLGFDAGIRVIDYTVSPMDILSFAAATAAGLRILGRARTDIIELLWLLAALALLAAFAHGVQAYGFQSAAIFYRRFFYLTTAIVYVLSFPWSSREIDRLVWIWTGVALILATAAIAGWLDLMPTPWVDKRAHGSVYDSERVLPASGALILAEAGLIGLATWSRLSTIGLQRLLPILFLVIMALLYHRTVWLATLAGIASIFLLQPRAVARLGIPLAVGFLVTVALWTLRLGLGDESLAQSMQAAIMEPFEETSTYNWRVEGWEILLSRAFSDGIATIVMGSGFGVGYGRQMGWALVEYSPHNFYLEIFLNAGLVGLALWLLAMTETGVRMFRGAALTSRRLDQAGALAVLVAMSFYNIPYSLTSEQGLLIGMLAAMVRPRAGERA